MKTAIYELPESPTEEDYRRCAALLPAWRRQQAEQYRMPADRLQCAKAYLLLADLVEDITGARQTLRFGYGEYGKPYLIALPRLHFNISHCARAVMCAVGDEPVGCDVETIPQEACGDVMDVCFSPEEKRRTEEAEDPAAEFTRTWTRKEALLKLRGTGLTDDIRYLLSSPAARGAVFNTVVRPGYVYTTCVWEKNTQGADTP